MELILHVHNYHRCYGKGDATKLSSLTLGKNFASPKKLSAPIHIPLHPTKMFKII